MKLELGQGFEPTLDLAIPYWVARRPAVLETQLRVPWL